ncbi:hypothetical protein [Bernardetia sp. MNP-M8]|uniref:hypothetical protein n=1 Tax=Bernardetia sp. MNP-M8 TaxID=3127470 RepID=UPI0030D4BFE6
MKTNYLLLILVFSFLALTSFSIPKNSISTSKKTESVIEKDTFNIMASHGIYLRDSANLTCNKLAKLPYATKIVLLNQDTISDELTVQETKYFEIKGRMQKVKVISQIDSLNNLEGYVFDGYLTKFPVPVLDYRGTQENDYLSSDLYYLQSNFKNHDRYEIKRQKYDGEDEYDCAFQQKFGSKKDIQYKQNSCGEGGMDWDMMIPNLSLREAYFFAIVLYYQEYYDENTIPHTITFDKKTKIISIEPSDQGAGCYISIIENKNKILTISGYCGC